MQHAFVHLQDKFSTDFSKLEATLQIKKQMLNKLYSYTDTNSCVVFLKSLEEEKEMLAS